MPSVENPCTASSNSSQAKSSLKAETCQLPSSAFTFLYRQLRPSGIVLSWNPFMKDFDRMPNIFSIALALLYQHVPPVRSRGNTPTELCNTGQVDVLASEKAAFTWLSVDTHHKANTLFQEVEVCRDQNTPTTPTARRMRSSQICHCKRRPLSTAHTCWERS